MNFEEEVSGISFLKIDAIINGQDYIQDKYEIENVLLVLQNMNKKLEFLKELKKRRVAAIDEQINKEELSIEKLEEAIKSCMHQNKDKTLDFPGVGKVQIRNTKGSWSIIDEEGLRSHLESLGKFEEVSEKSWKFRKKDLNKVLDDLKENNNVPPFVQKEPDKISLSLSFPKDNTQTVAPISNESKVVSNPQSSANIVI